MFERHHARVHLALALLLPIACSTAPVPAPDASVDVPAPDAAADADVMPRLDAAPDRVAAQDATPDAPADRATTTDVTVDAPRDAEPDVAPDATPDAVLADAARDAAVDASADAAVTCAVRLGDTEAVTTQVGASGGDVTAEIACMPGEVMVGAAARMSDGDTGNGTRSMHGLVVACATVGFGRGGPVVGPETLVEAQGHGRFGWTPSTLSAVTRCPPGWVVSGLRASRGESGELFVDVSITCSELRPDGTLSGMTRTLYVEGSIRTTTAMFDSATCPAGQAVRRMSARTGAGFDSATPSCAAPSCAR